MNLTKKQILSYKIELQSQPEYKIFVKMIKDASQHNFHQDRIDTLVCLALGDIQKSKKSQKQCALLLSLVEILKPSTTKVYDPIFSKNNISVLKSFGFSVAYSDTDLYPRDGLTMFYAPHAPFWVYGNIVNENLDNLPSIGLLGNDLKFIATQPLALDHMALQIAAASVDSRSQKLTEDSDWWHVLDDFVQFFEYL